MPCTILDTDRIAWEDHPGIPGYRRKLLSFDEVNQAEVRLGYVPAGKLPDGIQLPRRHYHKSVVERGYHLYGDFPHWEFSGPDDDEGELIVFRRHYFMDRPPRSLHGLFAEPTSQTGSVILYWNSGPGAAVADPEAASETVEIPFDGSFRPDGAEFVGGRVFDSRDTSWQQHPQVQAWKIKHLAGALNTALPVALVHIPADWVAPQPAVPTVAGDHRTRWLFVVAGDVRLAIDDGGAHQDAQVQENGYLAWRDDCSLSFAKGSISDSGCTALCVGHNLSRGTL